jgi:hypothetical protein
MLALDMTQQQIADELGLSLKAVQRRLAHFRERAANPVRPPRAPARPFVHEDGGMKASTLVGGSVLTSLVGGMFQLVGAPWGAVLVIVVLGLLCTFVLGLAQLAMPQESRDKVLLWEKVLLYRERRTTAAPATKTRPREAVADTPPKWDATTVALPHSAMSSENTPARSP